MDSKPLSSMGRKLTILFQVFLGFNPNIPVQSLQHEDLHPPSIPTSLLHTAHAPGLCHSSRIHRCLRSMDSHQCLGELRTYRQILGHFCARLLFRQEGSLVLEFCNSHFDRFDHLDIAYARPQVSPTAQKAEAGLDGCFCPWWIVRIVYL